MNYKQSKKLSKFILLGICTSLPLYGNISVAAETAIQIPLNTPSITTEFTRASIKVGDEFEYWVASSHKEDKSLRFKLVNAPKGMRIHSKSGVLTWTATMNQAGDFYPEIILLKNKVEVDRQYLELSVEHTDINYKGVFVSLKEKASFEDGSPESPFSTIKKACSSVEQGENIYIRGGRYNNPGKKMTVAGCKGGENKKQYITVRPWGNEQARIDFNGSSGIAVRNSEYTIIEGFEVKGENQSITYEQAIANWWNNEALYSGTGIRINDGDELTHHIIIKDNIVQSI